MCDCVGLDRTAHEHEQANHDEDRGLQANDRSRWHEGQHEQPVDGGPVRSGIFSPLRFLHVRTEPDQGQGQDREVVKDHVRIDERRREDDDPEADPNWRLAFPGAHGVPEHDGGKRRPQRETNPVGRESRQRSK